MKQEITPKSGTSGKTMKNKLLNLKYKFFKPKLKAEYQFGSPIVGLYTYEGLLVVATKLDIYVSEDGINYSRATNDRKK